MRNARTRYERVHVATGSQARRRLTGASIGAAALLFSVPCAEAARLVVTPSRSETLYSVTSDPDCSTLSMTADGALPFNVVRLRAEAPPNLNPDQVSYRWSPPNPEVGMLAADIDLGPGEQAAAIRTLCSELGNGCVLTAEQLNLYNKPTILWVAPGCDILPDKTAHPYGGGRVRIRVRASAGKKGLGKGSATVGFGRLGALTLLVADPGRPFRDGIGKPGGESIFINPAFAVRLSTRGATLPALEAVVFDSGAGGSVTQKPPCASNGEFAACTQSGDLLYSAGGKQVASATAELVDGSALCDKLTVNVRTATLTPKLEVSYTPRRKTLVPGDPASGSPILRVRLRNASPQGNLLLVGNVLTCASEVRVGPTTLNQTTQIDLQHCSLTLSQGCTSDADCQAARCSDCEPNEICLTSSHCSAAPIGCTTDKDCQPPRCPTCSATDACIQVLPLSQVFLGAGDAVDLIESSIPVLNTLTAPARVTDTWTVQTFNAGSDTAVVKYKIAPRPTVK